MQNLIESYRTHLRVLNYARKTIEGHVFYLNRFCAYLQAAGIGSISAVTRKAITDYQVHLISEINKYTGKPNTPSYLNKNLQSIKCFLRFLLEEGYLAENPARDIPYAREPQRLPRSVLTQSDMIKLLQAPVTGTILGYRDRTIFEVLYSTGMRKAELNNLLVADVDYEDGFIRINAGKGKKDRVVPLGRIACHYVKTYIKCVRPLLIRDQGNNYLFLSLRGNRLSKNMVWQYVKTYAAKADMNKNVSPHTFRHTCATLMLRNNANIRHIQELLGHSSLDSTQVYASVSIADLKIVHSRCHPRERDKV